MDIQMIDAAYVEGSTDGNYYNPRSSRDVPALVGRPGWRTGRTDRAGPHRPGEFRSGAPVDHRRQLRYAPIARPAGLPCRRAQPALALLPADPAGLFLVHLRRAATPRSGNVIRVLPRAGH